MKYFNVKMSLSKEYVVYGIEAIDEFEAKQIAVEEYGLEDFAEDLDYHVTSYEEDDE